MENSLDATSNAPQVPNGTHNDHSATTIDKIRRVCQCENPRCDCHRDDANVHCPAHNDANPSLSIDSGRNGAPVFRCFAGCSQDDVQRALKARGVWGSTTHRNGAAPKPEAPSLDARGLTTKTLESFGVQRVQSKAKNRDGWKYPTNHNDGTTGRTRFKNARPKSGGELKYQWWKGGDERQPDAYNLQNVPDAAPEVWIVGGEPDVWMMQQNDFLAVSTFGETQGAEKLIAALKTKNVGAVQIALDNDDAGYKGAKELARECQKQGVKFSLRRLDGFAGFDVCDEFSRCGRDEKRFRESMLTLPEMEADNEMRPRNNGNADNGDNAFTRRNIIGHTGAALLDLELPEPKYAVPSVISQGVGLLVGPPKIGKSWLTLGICIAVALRGRALGSIQVEQGDALYLALEDNTRRLKSRLQKILECEQTSPQGLEKLHLFTEWERINEGGLERLNDWMKAHPDTRLIVIDTLEKIRPRRKGGSVYGDDYGACELLKSFADAHGVAVVIVHHTRKGIGDDAVEAVSGSYGLTGGVDSVLTLKRERGRGDASLFITGRDVNEQDLALKWDADLCLWSILGDADEYRMSNQRANVLNVLREADAPLSPKEVAERTGMKPDHARQMLFKMKNAGQVSNVGNKYSVTAVTNVIGVTSVIGVIAETPKKRAKRKPTNDAASEHYPAPDPFDDEEEEETQ